MHWWVYFRIYAIGGNPWVTTYVDGYCMSNLLPPSKRRCDHALVTCCKHLTNTTVWVQPCEGVLVCQECLADVERNPDSVPLDDLVLLCTECLQKHMKAMGKFATIYQAVSHRVTGETALIPLHRDLN